MDILLMIGTLAALLTTLSFVPQVIKAHTTKKTQDLSFGMFMLLSVGLILWLVYGIALRSLPIIFANSITLAFSLYLLYLKKKHG
ncbi:MAG: SemiSWEET transporter [Candidatus Margulisiibacteriota bacterium]|nr:SemiSWEET transporter [Candidatus Margulisiibacteriota bacterium]